METKQLFNFLVGQQRLTVPYEEIDFFESKGRKIRLIKNGQISYEFYGKLSEVLSRLVEGKFVELDSSDSKDFRQVQRQLH